MNSPRNDSVVGGLIPKRGQSKKDESKQERLNAHYGWPSLHTGR
jgi:hypothetical protein